jgi:hypothetical protein
MHALFLLHVLILKIQPSSAKILLFLLTPRLDISIQILRIFFFLKKKEKKKQSFISDYHKLQLKKI